MAKNYWLVKSEPSAYSWEDLQKDRQTRWEGVRNFAARNNLRAMKKGELILFYHSGEGKEIVGIAKAVKEAYEDPTAKEGEWSAVDIAPLVALGRSLGLATLKADRGLAGMSLLRRPRLSVSPVTPTEFARILELSGTRVPGL